MSDLGNSSWSPIDASNDAVPPNGWPEGMAPSNVNNSARAQMGGEKRFWQHINPTLTTGGTDTAYTLTYTVAPEALYPEIFSFIVDQDCGAAPTLNVNTLGAKALRRWDGATAAWLAVAAGELRADQVVMAYYNSGGSGSYDIIGMHIFPAFSVVVQKFTATGTYTPTAGMVYCEIESLGAGGGGGGTAGGGAANGANAGGGGAGSLSTLLATAADIGASKPVTIGAAGTAGVAGNNDGGDGGDTSVGALCIGKGGKGGKGILTPNTNALGGLGGAAGTGTTTPTGQPGGTGMGFTASFGASGAGGSSPYGGGARPLSANVGTGVTGEAGTGKGSGGSGGASYDNGGTAAGGAGTAGYVVITEYVYA